jgi:hypothetical protein
MMPNISNEFKYQKSKIKFSITDSGENVHAQKESAWKLPGDISSIVHISDIFQLHSQVVARFSDHPDPYFKIVVFIIRATSTEWCGKFDW